jgi:hypothetical protein
MKESEFIKIVLEKSKEKDVVSGIRKLLNPDDYNASLKFFCEDTGISMSSAKNFIRKLFPFSIREENRRKLVMRLRKSGYTSIEDYFLKNRGGVSLSVMADFLGVAPTTVQGWYKRFLRGE